MGDKESIFPLNVQLFAGADTTEGGNPEGAGADTTEGGNPEGAGSDTTEGGNPEPLTWEGVNTGEYKSIPADQLSTMLENYKKNGVTPERAQENISSYNYYLEKEREAMTPELRGLDPLITNYLAQEENTEFKDVISRLAENAGGRKFLAERLLKESKGGSNPMDNNGLMGVSKDEFIDKFNEAYALDKKGDSTKMKELIAFADQSEDKFFKDFIGK